MMFTSDILDPGRLELCQWGCPFRGLWISREWRGVSNLGIDRTMDKGHPQLSKETLPIITCMKFRLANWISSWVISWEWDEQNWIGDHIFAIYWARMDKVCLEQGNLGVSWNVWLALQPSCNCSKEKKTSFRFFLFVEAQRSWWVKDIIYVFSGTFRLDSCQPGIVEVLQLLVKMQLPLHEYVWGTGWMER